MPHRHLSRNFLETGLYLERGYMCRNIENNYSDRQLALVNRAGFAGG